MDGNQRETVMDKSQKEFPQTEDKPADRNKEVPKNEAPVSQSNKQTKKEVSQNEMKDVPQNEDSTSQSAFKELRKEIEKLNSSGCDNEAVEDDEDEQDDSLQIDCDDDVEDDNVGKTPEPGTSSSKAGSPVGKRRRPRKEVQIPKEVQDMDFESDMDALVERGKKHGMNRSIVKSAIRAMLSNEDLLRLVMEKSGDEASGGDSPTKFERLTRAKAKSVVEGGGKLNDWVLEHYPTPSKPKNPDFEVLLTEQELPDDDGEGDPDFVVGPDAANSDEDSVATTSEIGTPVSAGVSPSSTKARQEEVFKEPRPKSSAMRALDFDDEPEHRPETRSMKSLKDVPIDQLEKEFQFPDVMDDASVEADQNEVDETYLHFLAEMNNPSAANMPEDDDDADFEYREDDIDIQDIQEEYKDDRSSKAPKSEVTDLFEELNELNDAALDLDSDDEENTRRFHHSNFNKRVENFERQQKAYREKIKQERLDNNEKKYQIVGEERDLLEHQLRQHIQLLTQTVLLTSNSPEIPEFVEANQEAKSMFSELIHFSFWKQYSIYAQPNLFPSNQAILDWEASGNSPFDPASTTSSKRRMYAPYDLSTEIKDHIGSKSAFMYPHLLPEKALRPTPTNRLINFIRSEDYLILSGMNRFEKCKRTRINSFMNDACKLIAEHTMPTKTWKQIRDRIKNCRSKRVNSDVSTYIRYYLENPVAAKALKFYYDDYEPFDNSKMLAPKDRYAEELPVTWRQFLRPSWQEHDGPRDVWEKYAVDKFLMKSQCGEQREVKPKQVKMEENYDACTTVVAQFSLPTFSSPTKSESIVITAPVSTTPSKFRHIKSKGELKSLAKSPLKTHRERILKKYKKSPMKRIRPIRPKPELTEVEMPEEEEAGRTATEMLADENVRICITSETDTGITVAEDPSQDFESTEEAISLENFEMGSSALTASTSTQAVARRKKKQQRETEMTLQLLEGETDEEAIARADRDANELLAYIQENLDESQLLKFHELMTTENLSSSSLFLELHEMFMGNIDVQENLLDLLTPEEAFELGMDIYLQFKQRQTLKELLFKIGIMYKGQPAVHNRVIKELTAISTKLDPTVEELKSVGTKLFKGNQHLIDLFMSLIPEATPPDSLLPAPEMLDLTSDDPPASDLLGFECLELPDVQDSFGDDSGCACACHTEASPDQHCCHCALRFYNGRVYIREGKMLKSVRVEYPSRDRDVQSDRKKIKANRTRKNSESVLK